MSADGCEILSLSEPAHRARAADVLRAGEIVISAFNGIFVLLGDADDPRVPEKVAAAKQRPQAKGVALVCPPEFFGEHVSLDVPASHRYELAQIQALYRALHAVGVIVPAALPCAPPHVVQAGTILNVWTEQPPASPLRELVLELRRRGGRALAGTSANRTGEPTLTDADEVLATFADRVPVILLEDFHRVPLPRRRSASIVDLTGQEPRIVREGSVPADELARALRRLGLGELVMAPASRSPAP